MRCAVCGKDMDYGVCTLFGVEMCSHCYNMYKSVIEDNKQRVNELYDCANHMGALEKLKQAIDAVLKSDIYDTLNPIPEISYCSEEINIIYGAVKDKRNISIRIGLLEKTLLDEPRFRVYKLWTNSDDSSVVVTGYNIIESKLKEDKSASVPYDTLNILVETVKGEQYIIDLSNGGIHRKITYTSKGPNSIWIAGSEKVTGFVSFNSTISKHALEVYNGLENFKNLAYDWCFKNGHCGMSELMMCKCIMFTSTPGSKKSVCDLSMGENAIASMTFIPFLSMHVCKIE